MVATRCATGAVDRGRAHLNEPARGLLAEFVDAEQLPHRILARPSADGDSDTLAGDGALITILELQCDRSGISAGTLVALTPRKSDVAHSS
jgi:hypothetical protein